VKQIILAGLLALFTLGATPLARADAAPAATAAEKQPLATGTVNINTATEMELSNLPGVGASKAANVVTYRQHHGNFTKVDDLMKVKGFGRKNFARIRPLLATDGPTTYRNPKKATMSSLLPTPIGTK
jgi:competence protein ComEA